MGKSSKQKKVQKAVPVVATVPESEIEEIEEVVVFNDVKDDKKITSIAKLSEEDEAAKLQSVKDQSRVAIGALRKYLAAKGGKSLFPDIDNALNISVVYKKPALITEHGKAYIEIPHSSRTPSNTSVCIIMPDLEQSEKARSDPDVDKQARQWADIIEKDHGLTSQHYAKLMTRRQVEREYRTYKEKRALASLYDLFLVDARVYKSVTSFLGKEFFSVHKEPFLFKYEKPLVSSIEQCCRMVRLPLRRYMTRTAVPIGHLGQSSADIGANIDTVLDKIVNACPGGLINIRSIYLHPTSTQPNLPIYLDDGPATDVILPKESDEKRNDLEINEDECSTLPEGLKLQVRRNGKVRVIDEKTGELVIYPTVTDEWDERDLQNAIPTVKKQDIMKKRADRREKRELKEKQASEPAVSKKKKKTSV